MGKSSQRKGQRDPGTSGERSAQALANRAKARADNVLRLTEPDTPPEEVAALLASDFADWAGAGTVAHARLRAGAPSSLRPRPA